jgi:hypothetical protein
MLVDTAREAATLSRVVQFQQRAATECRPYKEVSFIWDNLRSEPRFGELVKRMRIEQLK